MALIGRQRESAILRGLLNSDESELVSVIGRRRVGKTFLIQSVYAEHISFEITGIQHASLKEQLENFAVTLDLFSQSDLPVQRPRTWLEAFRLLILYLERRKGASKQVVFFDEMPWLSAHKSGFLNAFGFFWNSWAVKNNIVIVICGSAASWMIQKVVHNKGGLYNRITKRIHLQPFSLKETEAYLQSRGIRLNRYQITEIYMALGGIPHYLKEIEPGESVPQSIDRICFHPSGILYDEFMQLYPSLFDYADNHIAIVRMLASTWSGMTRTELIANTHFTNGGGLTKTLEELQYSGFLTEYIPMGKSKKASRYRLTDEYSLFYLTFIEPLKKEGPGVWLKFQQTPAWRSWSGFAFESICLKHIAAIRQGLGISGVFSQAYPFYHKGAEGMDGCQIDLLIDRDDQVINLCEIKWSIEAYVLTKAYAEALRKKIALFKHYSGTKKQVFLTLISTYGVVENEHSRAVVDKELGLDVLYE